MKYRFGDFEADTRSKELRKGGVLLKLGDQPFHVLGTLLERAGEEVPREELQRRIWPEGTYVDFDKGLNSAVNKVREALSDSADRPRYIATIPRRGYRFIAKLETDAELTASGARLAEPINGMPSGPPRSRHVLLTGAVAVLALAITTVVLWSRRQSGFTPIESLVILPFQPADAADRDYLAQGIGEQVTAILTTLPGVRIISPAAAHRLGSAGVSPQEVGRRLKVEAVLFGSVRRADQRIRVNVQMIRSTDGQVLWAEGGVNVDGADLIEAERLVATTIASRLKRSLTAAEQGAIARRPTSNADAYELYVRGRLAGRQATHDHEECLVAGKLLEQAVKLDPQFAEAWAWLAWTQYHQFSVGIAGDSVRKTALENARKALTIDPTVTAARRALIAIFHSTGQAEDGLKQAAILRQAGAADTDSLAAMGQAYLRGGMPDRALTLFQQALHSDPENDQLMHATSFAASWSRRYDLGLSVLKTSSSSHNFLTMMNALGSGNAELARSAALGAMRRADPFTFAMCWRNLQGIGGLVEALQIWRTRKAEFERASAKLRNERIHIGLAIIYAGLNERREALEEIRLALIANPGDPWTSFFAAEAYGLLGDERNALDNLQHSIDRGFLSLFYVDHQFEYPGRGLYSFRNNPRFRALRDRLAAKIERLRIRY